MGPADAEAWVRVTDGYDLCGQTFVVEQLSGADGLPDIALGGCPPDLSGTSVLGAENEGAIVILDHLVLFP